MRIRTLAGLLGALTFFTGLPAHAVGTALDVEIVDRTTGESLSPIYHEGEWWIAGRPGARYGVTIANLNGRRTLNVISIDGVNAMSGDTAAWNQTGYVLGPYQRTEIDGWRKNANQVAAFEFTALPDSYAARTGRAAYVGIIGIAMFNERTPRPLRQSNVQQRSSRPSEAPIDRPAPQPSPSPLPVPPQADGVASSRMSQPDDRAEEAKPAGAPLQRERLGTGHGAIEESSIVQVAFERARRQPDEIVTINYDRRENLVARGILPALTAPYRATDPFPGSSRYVPDPPPR